MPKEMGSSLALDQIFLMSFRPCETFFRNFFMSLKGPPSIFKILCNRMDVKKTQRVNLFTFFGTKRLTRDFKKIEKKNTFREKNFLIRVL